MRVLLADDHRLLTEGLSDLLAAHGLEVAGIAADGLEAIALAERLQPDLILMDIRMPRCDGLEATRRIKALHPQARIIMLTTSAEDQDLFESVKAGACGYLLKSISGEAFIDALHDAQQGIPPFSPGLASRLLREFARLGNAQPQAAQRAGLLTARQLEVLRLVAGGLTYKQVGEQLSLSERTVRFHMSEIMARLHLENRSQVLAYVERLGIKPPG